MADLFISYAKPDRPHALGLAEELRAKGFSVWIDREGIGGAKNWTAEIVEAIDACSTLLILLSADSVASRNVAKEVQLASDKKKNILPVVLEKVTLPAVFEYPLVGLQRVNFQDRPAIFRALESLSRELATTGNLAQIFAPQPNDSEVRVAVLPFDDLSPKRDNQWFADGMMDELIGRLSHLENVKVPGRSDVLHYRRRAPQSREIARELGVRYLIEGGVRKAGKKIRINASLTDTQRAEQLWANQFDGSFDDVFAFQELVAHHIADALKLHLTPQEQEQIEERPTQNAEAYELYLKGRQEQYYLTRESYERALDLYERAARLDPTFSQAHIGIASVCCVMYREYSRNSQWLERAEEAASRAEAIGGETSKSLYIRGMIEWVRGENIQAIATLERAVSLDRKNHNAAEILGALQMEQGDYGAAAKAFRNIIQSKESTISYFNLLIALDAERNTDELIATAEEAIPIFDRYLMREPNNYSAAVSRAWVLLFAGLKSEAMEAALALLEVRELQGGALYNLGCLFDSLGNTDLYLQLLRRAIGSGYREIEQTKRYPLLSSNPAHREELNNILLELEAIVKSESQ